jgi:hypothetical protein
MRFPGFWRASFSAPKPNAEAVARVKDWARATLQAAPDTAFAVNEIACNDPACPGLETVILVMEPGKKNPCPEGLEGPRGGHGRGRARSAVRVGTREREPL